MDRLAERRGLTGDVYQPAEDSYLLASVCTGRIDEGATVVDVGTGSGFVGEQIRSETNATVIGIDLNPHACRQAQKLGLPVIRGNLLDPITANSVDVVVCNPPYLPRDPGPERDDWLATAVVGGETGREVVTTLIDDLDRVLRQSGSAFVLLSSLMDIECVTKTVESAGFSAIERDRDASFPFEVLVVVEVRRA